LQILHYYFVLGFPSIMIISFMRFFVNENEGKRFLPYSIRFFFVIPLPFHLFM